MLITATSHAVGEARWTGAERTRDGADTRSRRTARGSRAAPRRGEHPGDGDARGRKRRRAAAAPASRGRYPHPRRGPEHLGLLVDHRLDRRHRACVRGVDDGRPRFSRWAHRGVGRAASYAGGQAASQDRGGKEAAPARETHAADHHRSERGLVAHDSSAQRQRPVIAGGRRDLTATAVRVDATPDRGTRIRTARAEPAATDEPEGAAPDGPGRPAADGSARDHTDHGLRAAAPTGPAAASALPGQPVRLTPCGRTTWCRSRR
ncbi:MAG: hypothetical protein JWM72_4398 [Actinomycetia bacterium]|nr:hypothetical protein [Actinomycetes bacterium]